MRLFVRVVERGSFTAAAVDLGMPRSTATETMKALETSLGARLLDRTTRHVAPTLDGRDYYQRCLSILADVDEAEGALRGAEPRGLLRVDAHGLITRAFLLPHLPDFLNRYPAIDLHFGQSDRLVDLVREGVDVVIRAGELTDSGLIARRLGLIEEITVASPAYLAKHGVPHTPDDLADHAMIGFLSSRTGEIMPLEFAIEGSCAKCASAPGSPWIIPTRWLIWRAAAGGWSRHHATGSPQTLPRESSSRCFRIILRARRRCLPSTRKTVKYH